MSLFSLAGKTAVITGSTRGIGGVRPVPQNTQPPRRR